MHEAFALEAGDVLRLGTARTGLRTYVAFRGGIDVPLVLGSAATDLLTGLGPARLAAARRIAGRGSRRRARIRCAHPAAAPIN